MDENLKIVETYTTPIEADVVRNRLEAAGIQAFLGDEFSVGWLWHLGTALSGVKVLVAESDLPRAREILQELEPQVEDRPSPTWSCSKCGAEVDGELDVCWACGTTADGVEDPDFQDADAAATPRPAKETTLKRPPGVFLAVLVAFCMPIFVFNVLFGIDFLVYEARHTASSGLWLLILAADFLLVVGLFQWLYYQPASLPDMAAAPPVETATDAALAEQEAGELAAAGTIARRACLAAVLGMAFCPVLLNLYSLWLILKYQLYRPTVHRQWGLVVYTAIVIDTVVCLMTLVLFLLAGGLART